MYKNYLPLICGLLFAVSPTVLSAQVGVNNESPEQTLDVNGKIKVGDDDIAPSDGTIRYNNPGEDLEGFVDGEWRSLTKSLVPDSPEPGMFYDFSVPATSTWGIFDRFERTSDRLSISPTEVPGGKLFVVDQICVTATTGDESTLFYAGVRMASNEDDSFGINPQIFISGSRKDGTKCIQANRVPLLILRSGNSLYRWNSSDSDAQVRILVYGMFVDQLSDYFRF